MIKHIKSHSLLYLIALYLVVRLINLTIIPIFNDEAIYLDWGWRETHVPGFLFYSLYDGKTPLLMWLFGIAETILPDPLVAGRLVSVLAGACTLWGIYKISKSFLNSKIAYLSSVLYIFIPLFEIYDRQALMESSIAAIGVFSCYFALKLWSTDKQRYAYFLGIFLGLGILIKYSAVIFILAYLIISCLIWVRHRQNLIVKQAGIVFAMLFVTTFILIINSEFALSFSRGSRYSIFAEPLNSAIVGLFSNIGINLMISFFYLTPLIFLAGISGIILLKKEKNRMQFLLVTWIIACLVLQTLTIHNTSQRYLVPYLPLLVIPAAYTLYKLSIRWKHTLWIFLTLSLIIPVIFTYLLITNPPTYFFTMKKIDPNADMGFVTGQTSGIFNDGSDKLYRVNIWL